MKFANVRELKNKTSRVLRMAARGKDILITSHGKPVAILHGIDEDEIEDYIIRHHPAFRKSLVDAEITYRKRRGVSLERVLERLEKKRGRL